MNYIVAFIAAGIAGICVALEPAINSSLGRYIPARLVPLHGFLLGTLIMVIVNLANGGFREYKGIIKAPIYLWIGGIIGLIIVYAGMKVAPIIGVANLVTVMVAAQLITSIIIDIFGLFGTTKVPLDKGRIVGALLLVAGAKLIIK